MTMRDTVLPWPPPVIPGMQSLSVMSTSIGPVVARTNMRP